MKETRVSDLHLAAYLATLDHPLVRIEGPPARRDQEECLVTSAEPRTKRVIQIARNPSARGSESTRTFQWTTR